MALFESIVVCEFYSFNIGVLYPNKLDQLRNSLCPNDNLDESVCLAKCVGGNLKDPKHITANGLNLLKVLNHFDTKYLYPEFRDRRHAERFLFPPLQISHNGSITEVQVVLTIHRSGVGTFMFLMTDLSASDSDELREIVTFHKRTVSVTCHDRTARYIAQAGGSVPQAASLDDMLVIHLRLLDPTLLLENGIEDNTDDSEEKIRKSSVNHYQFISIDGVPSEIDTIDNFIIANKVPLVDAAEAYSYFEKPEFSYSRSRKEEFLLREFPSESSQRKHLHYQINDRRLFAISSIMAHPEIYSYATNKPWYSSHLGLIELVYSQFEVLYVLHGRLWDDPQEYGEVLSLEERAFVSLSDYLNARVIDHPQGNKFMNRLRKALNVDDYFKVVNARLELAHSTAVERYNGLLATASMKLSRQSRGLTIAALVLSAVLAISGAGVLFDIFSPPNNNTKCVEVTPASGLKYDASVPTDQSFAEMPAPFLPNYDNLTVLRLCERPNSNPRSAIAIVGIWLGIMIIVVLSFLGFSRGSDGD